MVSQIAYHEGMVPTRSAELHGAIKKRVVGILATANFQDLQYLKDCQFEFEVRSTCPHHHSVISIRLLTARLVWVNE
jgi:hypothetical protein